MKITQTKVREKIKRRLIKNGYKDYPSILRPEKIKQLRHTVKFFKPVFLQ